MSRSCRFHIAEIRCSERGDYYQDRRRCATVRGKRPPAQAASSGGRRHCGRAAQIAIELLDDLGQGAGAVLIVDPRPGGRRNQQALGAEHRRSVPTNQRQFRSRPASIDAGTVTWVHRKPFWKGVSASKVEERRPPITDSSV